MLACLLGVASSLSSPDPGVTFGGQGQSIATVLPGSPAWRAGIRAGQRVIGASTATGLDWELTTIGPEGTHGFGIRDAMAEQANLALLALIAAASAAAALVLSRQYPRPAAALGAVAGSVGLLPALFGGDALSSSLAGALTIALPAWWLVLAAPTARWRRSTGGGIFALLLGWLIVRLALPDLYAPLEALRVAAAAGLCVSVLAVGMPWDALGRRIRSVGASGLVDSLGVLLLVLDALVLWFVAHVPAPIELALIALALVVYGRGRRAAIGFVDRALFGQLRERAAIAVLEADRVRLARELHDSPLQELTSVIRRLESKSDAGPEAALLRNVAADIRAVATDLHPPALDDLGLGRAIEYLVERANSEAGFVHVECRLDDGARIARERRVPEDVELAMFRIVQEAVTNAQRHSHATLIEITGEITSDHLDLVVADDGVGLADSTRREAAQQGHLGLVSMRQRAAAIGARLDVIGAPSAGTTVAISWRRGR